MCVCLCACIRALVCSVTTVSALFEHVLLSFLRPVFYVYTYVHLHLPKAINHMLMPNLQFPVVAITKN